MKIRLPFGPAARHRQLRMAETIVLHERRRKRAEVEALLREIAEPIETECRRAA